MADNPQEFDFPIGKVVGRKGDTGNGISSIELLQTVGLNKTYRITLTDETYFDFVVTDGNGISGVSFNPETYTLTLTFDDGTSYTTGSLRGAPGAPGNDGISPAVTITTITGGHRVTITDKTHPSGQTFDVMDGVIHSVNGKSAASITLDSGDIEFDDSETYAAGSIGAEVSNAKNAIDQLEGQVVTDVTVTGTIVTIVAQANKRYLCGTVSTIDVTPCVTGAFDLIFTSGSTAAVLTIPNTVKWQDSSFDPTTLDANTTYEISVADGTLGLVAKWT